MNSTALSLVAPPLLSGKLVLSAFGSILPVALSEGEERVVKAGHVLAWAETTGVSFGGFGGEGSVVPPQEKS